MKSVKRERVNEMDNKAEWIQRYEKLVKKKRRMDMKKETVPSSCNSCDFYCPEFEFRMCFFAKCPYRKKQNVFRDERIKTKLH